MDRILVVFYSYTGTCRKLARLLCAQMDWALGQVVEMRPRAGPAGTLRCVVDSLLHRRPPIRYEGPDPAQSDAVVLVSPIWVYGLASPMRSFVAAYGAEFRQVAVVSAMDGKGASGAVAEIGNLLGREPLLSTAFTARAVDDGSSALRLRAFGQSLQQTGRAAAASVGRTWSARGA
jgi:flavodoxin